MRKGILQEFVSLDGLAAGPNDSVDFVPASSQGDKSVGEEQFKLITASLRFGENNVVMRRLHIGLGAQPNGLLEERLTEPAKLADRVVTPGEGSAEPGVRVAKCN